MGQVYTREEVCIGCRLCEIYCQAQHSASQNLVKAFKKEYPRPVARIRAEQKGVISLAVPCRQCADPLCVYACLSGAIHRESDTGRVVVDDEKCVGCWTCILACPFGAIRQDVHRGKIAKCDLCPGMALPVCVANCPNKALVYAERA